MNKEIQLNKKDKLIILFEGHQFILSYDEASMENLKLIKEN